MSDSSDVDSPHERFQIGGESGENVYETIFCEIEDAVFLIDVEQTDGDYTFTFQRNNASHQEQTGISEDEMRGQTPTELLGEEQGAEVSARYRRCVEQGETIEYEETLDLPGGTRHWQTKLTPIIEDGDVSGIVGVARDVTERKEQQRELRQTHRRFETVLDTMSAAVFLKDTDSQYILMNQACRELLDVEDQDIIGLTDEELFPADTAERARSDDRHVIETGEMTEVEEVIQGAEEDSVRLTRKSPVYDENGEVTAVCGVSTDITDQKQREQELEATKQRLSLALTGTDTGVWEWDLDTDEVVWTESMERLFGVESGTFDGTYEAFTEYVHPNDIPAVEKAIEQTVSTGEPLQVEYRIQSGADEKLWGEARAELVEDDDGSRRIVGIVTDITDRKRDEQALQAARRNLRKVIDLVPDLIFAKNREGEYLLANEATAKAYGLTPADVESKREVEILPGANDSDEFREDDIDVIESGEPKEIPEETLTTADGEVRVFQTTKIPYQVPGSGDDAMLGYARDITDLKAYEQTLEEQRDTLELLNKVMRHDIRNKLTVMVSYTELLQESLTDETDREYARRVLNAGQEVVEISEMAEDVTDVLLRADVDRSPVELRPVLERQIEQIRSDHERATVAVEGTIPDVAVLADDMLEVVFRNILTNAIFHNDKDIPEITVSGHLSEGTVRIRIADNGPGIADDHKEQIFAEGEQGLDSTGTGLGLYLVKTLVDQYDGAVRVEDNEPEGSVFVVVLPTVE
ncbi:PAS domain-containing protein [Halapricum desulfuricans]|uniref:PAS domain-containing protein n=1 Tax=Halapricum desulfuricans TaxID=2841257 RepID=UPI001E618E4B|nr:PAS domain-containing protein [Halapricum desulfuricans]